MGDLAIFRLNMERLDWGPEWAWSRELDERNRREVAAWAADTGGLLITPHDPVTPFFRMARDGESYSAIALRG